MSVIRQLEERNNFGSQERNSSDNDEMISLSVLRKLEKQFDDMTHAVHHVWGPKLEDMEGRFKKLELAVEKLSASVMSVTNVSTPSSRPRCLKLRFDNKISSPTLTGQEIKGEGGNFIEVALVDDTGKVMDSGPEAFATVKIVAIKCDLDENGHPGKIADFDDISGEKTGKKSVLVGNVQLKLNNGTGFISNIKFRSSSSHNGGVFKLGATIVDSFDGTQVKEAKTESFIVKDYRQKYKEKHYPPSLSDDIWRLENIGKGGSIHERLRKEKVNTVEDLLILNLKDSERLKHILRLPAKKWEATMNHARTCIIDSKIYCSISSGENKGVVFNVVGKVLGLISESKYVSLDKLSEVDKSDDSKLVAAAFIHQEEWVDFDDEASLTQYLSHQLTALNPLTLSMLESTTGHEVEVSEISEYDHTNLDTSSHEIASSRNSTVNTSFISGDTNSVNELEIGDSCQLPDHGFYCPIFSPMPYHEECYLGSLINDYGFPQTLAGESHSDDLNFNTADAIIESPAVSYPEVRKRLFILFTISKWLMQIERMAAFEESNNQKKQRVG